MSTQPDIAEHQSPEVDNRQPVGVDRTACLLRHEVVHDAEEACSQVEAHSIVTPPPLHHGILYARKEGVGLKQIDRNRQAVDNVQIGNHHHHAQEEPVGHIDVGGLACRNRHHEVERIDKPDDGDQQIDRPLKLSILLGLSDTERVADNRQHDDQVPAEEHKPSQLVTPESDTTGALDTIVRRCHQCTPTKSENNRIGMERTQTPKCYVFKIEI